MNERRCRHCKCVLRTGNLTAYCAAHRHLDMQSPGPLARHDMMMVELSEERERLSDKTRWSPNPFFQGEEDD